MTIKQDYKKLEKISQILLRKMEGTIRAMTNSRKQEEITSETVPELNGLTRNTKGQTARSRASTSSQTCLVPNSKGTCNLINKKKDLIMENQRYKLQLRWMILMKLNLISWPSNLLLNLPLIGEMSMESTMSHLSKIKASVDLAGLSQLQLNWNQTKTSEQVLPLIAISQNNSQSIVPLPMVHTDAMEDGCTMPSTT